MPHGSRYWRYKYRYEGRHKTLALGVSPDIPARRARARHQAARQWLAVGIDPALKKEELRRLAGGTDQQVYAVVERRLPVPATTRRLAHIGVRPNLQACRHRG